MERRSLSCADLDNVSKNVDGVFVFAHSCSAFLFEVLPCGNSLCLLESMLLCYVAYSLEHRLLSCADPNHVSKNTDGVFVFVNSLRLDFI